MSKQFDAYIANMQKENERLKARLAEAERLLGDALRRAWRHEASSGFWVEAVEKFLPASDSAIACSCFGSTARDLDCPVHGGCQKCDSPLECQHFPECRTSPTVSGS
jgi:hypothetical protein